MSGMNSTSPAALSTLPAPPPEPIKVCSCCHRVIDDETWESLPYVGMQDDGEGGWLELRNHTCGSTLALETTREPRGWEVA